MHIIKTVIHHIQSIDRILVDLSYVNFFSTYESNYCSFKSRSSLVGILCAKQAFIAAIAELPDIPAFEISEIELRHRETGQPWMQLSDRLQDWFQSNGQNNFQSNGVTIDVSITHSGDYAAATVLLSAQILTN